MDIGAGGLPSGLALGVVIAALLFADRLGGASALALRVAQLALALALVMLVLEATATVAGPFEPNLDAFDPSETEIAEASSDYAERRSVTGTAHVAGGDRPGRAGRGAPGEAESVRSRPPRGGRPAATGGSARCVAGRRRSVVLCWVLPVRARARGRRRRAQRRSPGRARRRRRAARRDHPPPLGARLGRWGGGVRRLRSAGPLSTPDADVSR